MNEIFNKFLLGGDKFMPKIYIKQPGFTYSACGSFSKKKERTQQFKERTDTDLFMEMNQIKLVFSMIWLMEIFKIKQEGQLLIKP